MRALILTGRGVQDQELIYPLYRLDEAGWEVDVAARGVWHHGYGPRMAFSGIQGVKFEADLDVPTAGAHVTKKYDLLVIPGGVKAMEHLRLDLDAVKLVAYFHGAGKVVAAICSGPMMLISAGLAKGRKIACYPAWRVDVENAGGEFVEAPAVVDDRVVTSPHYRHAGRWMAAVLTAVQYPEGWR